MTPARLQEIDELFQAAVAQAPNERNAYLDHRCAGDASLRRDVAALLAADSKVDDFVQIAKGVAADWADRKDRPEFVGQRFGRYEVLERLGVGGMGEVYLAEDVTLHRKVALKLLPRQFTQDADRLRRFEQEAHAASALNHPSIITIHEVGQWDGTHFIAQEFIEGETLNDKVQNTRLPLDEVLDIGCQTAGALAAAHAAGIVHRDIKPANIMLRRDGYIKVLDFGLAKLSTIEPRLDLTEPGRVMGTVNYMSPEQALGKPLDHRTDIFSLGVVLYEIATGTRLFAGRSEAATYNCILNQEPPPLRDVDPALPEELDLVLRRALEKDPARRYHSATDLRDDLRRLAAGSEQTEAGRLAFTRERAHRRSRNLRFAALAALLLALVAGVFFAGSRKDEKRRASPPREIPRKSIAVLPFENLSSGEDAAFASGVQDQVLNDLTRLSELKVISRASVLHYQPGAPRDLREISQQLRVAYILEGSVEQAGDKVRVTARLRDAMRDTQVWTQTYERERADVFAIQSEIAQAIARELRTTLSPAEKADIERQPTRDLSAFTLYTRGQALVNAARASDDSQVNFRAGIELLNEAVARDPSFHVAYCALADAHASVFLYGIDNTPARVAMAEAAVAAARRLSPDSGDTHLASARVLYAGLQYDQAREELEVARRSLPNDPRIILAGAYIHRRQGHWEDATREFERALEFDPLNTELLQDLGSNYTALHRFADLVAVLDRAIALRPDRIGLQLWRGQVALEERADPGPLRAVLEAKMKEDPASAKAQMDTRLTLAFSERDFTGIANALAELGNRRYGTDWARFSRAFGEGLLARMTGDEVTARRAFAADRITQLALVEAQPDYGPAVSVLGLIEAGLGNKEEAIRLGRRAIELLPVGKDSIRGSYMIAHLAIIAAWVGETDLAIEQIRRFEKVTPAGFLYGVLKLSPMWDPLRGDPRFEAIVAAHAPGSSK